MGRTIELLDDLVGVHEVHLRVYWEDEEGN